MTSSDCPGCLHYRTPTEGVAYWCARRMEYVKWGQDTSECVDFIKGGENGTEANEETATGNP